MNKTERQMVEVLDKLKNDFGAVTIKAEFEAEGTRVDELLRLVDVTRTVGLPLTVKIGGCEAIRDLLESKQIGVRYVIAPMVETGYAASKYVAAKDIVYTPDEQEDTEFLLNMETITGFENREAIFEAIAGENGADGVVFGRVDFTGSLGWGRQAINEQRTTDFVIQTAELCKLHDKQLVMGGGVSNESIDAIRQVHKVRLDRFETRKVVFDAGKALHKDIDAALVSAVQFELLWLENKRDYYTGISVEDAKRISMLSARFEELQAEYAANH
jgi:2-keto-3-deoxy-L-rhamnonate aldolase RhmA